jgi:hypothetical protein
MKIKCVKAECEVCHVVGSVQIFLNNKGEIRYSRVRHYLKTEAGKPKFSYCQQSKSYAEKKLEEFNQQNLSRREDFNTVTASSSISKDNDHLELGHGNIDLELKESSSNLESGGWSSSLVRTLALRPKVNIDLGNGYVLNFYEFSRWVKSKYSVSYRNTILCYTRKYYRLVVAENLRDLDLLPSTIKNNVIKSLIVLSKYLGNYKDFSSRLKSFDIKTSRPDSLNAFLRILGASDSDVLSWYNSTMPLLNKNEQLLAKFLLHSGLRMDEAINSFNLIIQLGAEDKLSQYFDKSLSCLCHFKYPKLFIRRTKNCFITFISKEFLEEIAASQTVTYSSIRKRLERRKVKLRFNEFRDYFGTYLLQHGILEAEQNLCCGRIPVSIFIRHYWSPRLKELSNKIISLTTNMEEALPSSPLS